MVHRDLKPANIVLGDFGEVYVLDWGIARITEDNDEESQKDSFADIGQTMARHLGLPPLTSGKAFL